jgi:hypothetical protein
VFLEFLVAAFSQSCLWQRFEVGSLHVAGQWNSSQRNQQHCCNPVESLLVASPMRGLCGNEGLVRDIEAHVIISWQLAVLSLVHVSGSCRCALASQNAHHFQHPFHAYCFKVSLPMLRVLKLTPRQGTPMRAHFRPPDSRERSFRALLGKWEKGDGKRGRLKVSKMMCEFSQMSQTTPT